MSPHRLPVMVFLLVVFLAVGLIFLQVGLVAAAFGKLGLSPGQGLILFVCILLGSGVNVPLYATGRQVRRPQGRMRFAMRIGGRRYGAPEPGELVDQRVMVNVGGCFIPLVFSLSLGMDHGFPTGMLLAVALVTVLCFATARPMQGVGVTVPLFIPPLGAALAAVLLANTDMLHHAQAPAAAYAAGSVGTLLGADVLKLLQPATLRTLDAPVLSIGGAGTFDGIFLSGVIAVLLV